MCAPRLLRSAFASTQFDQSSLGAVWVAKDPKLLLADAQSDLSSLDAQIILFGSYLSHDPDKMSNVSQFGYVHLHS